MGVTGLYTSGGSGAGALPEKSQAGSKSIAKPSGVGKEGLDPFCQGQKVPLSKTVGGAETKKNRFALQCS